MSRPIGTASALLNASHWKWWESMLWLAAFAAPVLLPQHAPAISEIAIVALFALSLDLVVGYAGIVSLGHAAFFGLSAYAAALFAKHVHPDPLLGLLFGMAPATMLGFLASYTIHRGTDLTRVMVTLGTSLILLELANRMDWLTGGADGLQGVGIAPLLGYFEFDLGGKTSAFYTVAVLFVCFLLVRRVMHSTTGVSIKAIRDNRMRATAIGVPVTARLTVVYTLAAALAGVSGALLAQTAAFASLDVFEFQRSADVLLMLVIGGTGWLYGGILGAVVFKSLHTVLSGFTPQYWTFWLGLFLVVLVLVGRDRLIRPRQWFPTRRKALTHRVDAGARGDEQSEIATTGGKA